MENLSWRMWASLGCRPTIPECGAFGGRLPPVTEGAFCNGHYVRNIKLVDPFVEEDSTLQPVTGDYAIRIRLASRSNMEGVWVGFPDSGEYIDSNHPDELLLGLDALQAESLSECIALEVDCCLPQLTDILSQYDSAGELVRHAIDFGYVWAEQGQGNPTGWTSGKRCWSWRTATGWIWPWISHRISNTMRSFHGAWIWPHTGGNWRSETVSFHPAVWSQMPSMEPLMWRPACGGMVSPPRITAMQRGMAASSSTSTASLSTAALFCQCSCLDFVGYWYSYSPQSVIVFAKRGRNQ